MNILSVFDWGFGIEKRARTFGKLLWSPFPETKHEKSSNSDRIRRKNSGENSGRTFEKIRELSFCNSLREQKGHIRKTHKISENLLDGLVPLGHPAGVPARMPFSVRFFL